MKKNLEIIIIALVALNIFTIFKLDSIQNSIDYNYNQVRHAVENTDSRVSDITSNINSIIEKQGSILDSYEITFGDKLNPDLTVPVELSVTPKEYTEGTKVSFLINDKVISMQKNGASFASTVNINIFESFKPKVVIEHDGVQKTESIDEYYDIQQKYLLQVDGGYNGTESYRSGTYSLNGNIDIHIFSQQDNFPEDIDIVFDVNGKTVKEQKLEGLEIEKPDNSVYFANIDINEQIGLEAKDKLIVYAVIKDNFGLKYKYVFKFIEIDGKDNQVHRIPEWTTGTVVEISDENGNIIYVPEYLK